MKVLCILVAMALTLSNAQAQIKWRTPAKPKAPTKTESSGSSTQTQSGSSTSNPVGDMMGTLGGMVRGGSGSMTNDKAANGLKEALNVGTAAATNNLGKVDGFLANAAVKILLPPEARRVESTLRGLGMGSVCDQVITSVNRAAEGAVVEAKPIFIQAIKSMTISDAIGILTGGDGAATNYLRRTSGEVLKQRMQPIIKSNLDRTQATRYWGDAINQYNKIPLVQKANPDLSQFVTEKAIDGVFLMIAVEEKSIRANPAARIGSILTEVFGWADSQKK
ncbi:MAG: DUF4197 domain-containing protein [Chitinophagales bacterium]